MAAGPGGMTWSANEVLTLATKAARGGGAPPGQAALFGAAALCHLAANRSLDDLAEALAALPLGPILAIPTQLQKLVERAQGHERDMPFPQGGSLLQSYAEAHPNIAELDTARGMCRITFAHPVRASAKGRFDLSSNFIAVLQELTAATYVPDTDASRRAGAGAGLSDND